MLDFGKLNFSVSFNPTSAFPLDARSVFDSFEEAEDAAKNAVEVGSSNGTYYFGELIVVVENNTAKLYVIQPDKSLKEISGQETSSNYNIGSGLKLDRDTNTLSVDVATEVLEDNTLPITSAAVYTEVGNINVLLQTI